MDVRGRTADPEYDWNRGLPIFRSTDLTNWQRTTTIKPDNVSLDEGVYVSFNSKFITRYLGLQSADGLNWTI
jgi:beta-xylosidase